MREVQLFVTHPQPEPPQPFLKFQGLLSDGNSERPPELNIAFSRLGIWRSSGGWMMASISIRCKLQ